MAESKTMRVRADFNGLFGELLCLSHKDTCEDADPNYQELLVADTKIICTTLADSCPFWNRLWSATLTAYQFRPYVAPRLGLSSALEP